MRRKKAIFFLLRHRHYENNIIVLPVKQAISMWAAATRIHQRKVIWPQQFWYNKIIQKDTDIASIFISSVTDSKLATSIIHTYMSAYGYMWNANRNASIKGRIPHNTINCERCSKILIRIITRMPWVYVLPCHCTRSRVLPPVHIVDFFKRIFKKPCACLKHIWHDVIVPF